MKRFVLFVVMMSMILTSCFASASGSASAAAAAAGGALEENSENTEDIVQVRGAPVISELSPEQIATLQKHGSINVGPYTLTIYDREQFDAAMPYTMQVFTGTNAGVAGRTQFVGAETEQLTDHTSRLLYHFSVHTAYSWLHSSSYPFTLSLHPVHSDESYLQEGRPVTLLDVMQSPLGDQDFINSQDCGSFCRALTVGQLFGLITPEFDEQTEGGIRQNQRIIDLLLILAQQEGENIAGMLKASRDERGVGLFMSFLQTARLPLTSLTDALPKKVYTTVIPMMSRLILRNAGIDPAHTPSDKDIQTGLHESTEALKLNFAATDLKYFAGVHPATGHVIPKLVTKMRLASLQTIRPTDRMALTAEQHMRAYGMALAMANTDEIAVMAEGGQANIPMLLMRHAVLPQLEKGVIGVVNHQLARLIMARVPGGERLCCGLMNVALVSGKASPTQLIVDTARGRFSPLQTLRDGLRTPEGAEMLDVSARSIAGLIPFGALIYDGGQFILTHTGHITPMHAALGLDADAEVQGSALHTTAQGLRTVVRYVLPGGELLVQAARGGAWYIGQPTLTHAVYNRVFGAIEAPSEAVEKNNSGAGAAGGPGAGDGRTGNSSND